MNKQKNSIFIYFIYIISFAAILGIMLCCPRINDDYSFLSYNLKGLSDIVRFSLYYGNGRLLGNITSLLLIGNPVWFAVEKAVVLFTVVALLPKIFVFQKKSNNKVLLFLLSYVLVLGMSPLIFQEVITWSTCFQNYFPPITGLFICLFLLKSEKSSPQIHILIFIFGITSQLYLELNTLVNTALALVITFFCIRLYREKLFKSLTFLISSGLGTMLMFAIPKLFVDPVRQKTMADYRGVHLENIDDFRYTFMNKMDNLTAPVKQCIILLVILSVALCTAVSISGKKKRYKTLCISGISTLPVYCCVFQMNHIGDGFIGTETYRYVYLTLLAVFAISSFMCIGCMEKCTERTAAFISLSFVLISILPVSIVTPAAPRCSLLYYMFLVILTVIIVSYIKRKKKLANGFDVAVVICSLVLTFNLGINYYNVKLDAAKQVASIEAQMKNHADVIEVQEIDNQYMHRTAKRMFGYYYYYEKPFDVKFEYTK